jgi:outer membrane protein OmpA-like peptidoglycan-associated protein
VTIEAPAPPPQPKTSQLCSITFSKDKTRPARVDNEAKACLDEVALALQRSSDAKLALIGNANAKEQKTAAGKRLAAQRAANTKDYLVKEKGIDASRIDAYTGTGDDQSVTTTLIPTGATFDTSGATPVSEKVKATPRTAAHRSSKKK